MILERMLPVVGQEEDEGRSDDDLQPPPVSDEVGEQREDEDTNTEEHLVQNAHSLSVLYSNNLCDWQKDRKHPKWAYFKKKTITKWT